MLVNAKNAKCVSVCCSNHGNCLCESFVSETFSTNLVNRKVTCKERGTINGVVAASCYGRRSLSNTLKTKKAEAPPSN